LGSAIQVWMPKRLSGRRCIAPSVRSEWVMPWPGDHPVDRAGFDPLVGAEAVAVVELALVEIGHRGQPDMRMRAHVDALR
jgi:hypothetical protein